MDYGVTYHHHRKKKGNNVPLGPDSRHSPEVTQSDIPEDAVSLAG